MPLRLKEVHIVNEPFIFKIVWAIFKPLIKEKLASRVSKEKNLNLRGSLGRILKFDFELTFVCIDKNKGQNRSFLKFLFRKQ